MADVRKTGRSRTLSFTGTISLQSRYMVRTNLITGGSEVGYETFTRTAISSTGYGIWKNWFRFDVSAGISSRSVGGHAGGDYLQATAALSVQNLQANFKINSSGLPFSQSIVTSESPIIPFFGESGEWDAMATVTGSFLIEFDVEQWVETDGMPFPPRSPVNLGGPNGPSWAGEVDATPGYSQRYVEGIKNGTSSVRLTISLGSIICSRTWAYDAGGAQPIYFDIYNHYTGDCYAGVNCVSTEGHGGTASIIPVLSSIALTYPKTVSSSGSNVMPAISGSDLGNATPLGYRFDTGTLSIHPTYSYSRSASLSGGIVATASGMNFYALQPPGASRLNYYPDGTGAQLSRTPAMPVRVEGTLRNIDGSAYTPASPLIANWSTGGSGSRLITVAGSSFSDSVDFPAATSGNCGGETFNIAGAGGGWIYLYFTSGSLASAGEDNSDNRILIYGKVLDGTLSLEHAAELVVDEMASAGGWVGTDATISTDGSRVAIVATAADASAQKTFTPPAPHIEAYRYLRLQIRSMVGGNRTLQFRVGEWEWDITTTTAGIYAQVDIDLCIPARYVGEDTWTLDRDVRWPVDSLASNIPQSSARVAGRDSIPTYSIHGIPNGETIQIEDMRCVRKRDVEGQIMPTFKFFTKEIPDVGSGPALTEQFAKRFMLAIVDGKQGLEVPFQRQMRIGGTVSSHPSVTIAQLVAYINSFPGWTASESMGSGDAIYNNSLPSYLIGGAGVVLDPDGGTSTETHTFDPASGITIPIQFLLDTVMVHPGCGNPFTGEGYGTEAACVLRYHKFMRGAGHGLVLDSRYRAQVGVTARIQELPSLANAGEGASDAGGYFVTGSPFGRSSKSHEIAVGSTVLGTALFTARRRHRVSGRAATTTTAPIAPSNHSTPDGRLYRVHNQDSDIWALHSNSSVPLPSWSAQGQITGTGDASSPRIAEDYRNRAHVFYTRLIEGAYGAYSRYSDDNAESFSGESLFLANAKYVALAHSPDGDLVAACFVPNAGAEGPGKIFLAHQMVGEEDFSTPEAIVDDEGSALVFEDDSFGLEFGFDGAASLLLHATAESDSSTSVWSCWDLSEGNSFDNKRTGIASGLHPEIACSEFEDLLIAAHIPDEGTSGPGKVKQRLQRSGDVDFGTAAFIQDDAAADVVFEDTPFGLSFASDGDAARAVLSHVVLGEDEASEWQAWNEGPAFIRVG